MKSWTVVAYTFNAETVCLYCLWRKAAFAVEAAGHHNSEFVGLEDLLDTWARSEGIDREDERSFDSDDFPKVVFADSVVDDETCDVCHDEIL
jgi:hypothetical protein